MKTVKYILTGIALLSFQMHVHAQSGDFTIKGKVSDKFNAPLKIFLGDEEGNIKDSCELHQGNFQLKGQLDEPFKGIVVLQHNPGEPPLFRKGKADKKQFWIGEGTTTISGDDYISSSTAKSKIIEDEGKFEQMLKSVASKEALVQDTMMMNYNKDPEAANKKYSEGMRIILPERIKAIEQFINDRPDSYLGLTAINALLANNPDASVIHSLFVKLADQVKRTPKGREIQTIIDQLKTIDIGSQAPVFTQNDTQGKPVSLSDFKGKYVFIDFWASWCVPCRAENPDVVKAYAEFKDRNFTVLGVSLDGERSRQAWLDAIVKDQLSWAQVCDFKEWDNSAAKLYGVRSIPANFLIDPNGKIIAKNLHGQELGRKLNEFIK